MSVFVALAADDPAVVEIVDLYGFGPDAFSAHRFWLREDSGALWISSAAVEAVPDTQVDAVGLLVTRDRANPTRLSTAFVRRFGRQATRAVVTLAAEDTATYAAGQAVAWPADVPRTPYCIVVGTLTCADGTTPQVPIGRGRLHGSDVSSELPKASRFDVKL